MSSERAALPTALAMLGAGTGPPQARKSYTESEMQLLNAEKQTLEPSPGHKGAVKLFSLTQGFPPASP